MKLCSRTLSFFTLLILILVFPGNTTWAQSPTYDIYALEYAQGLSKVGFSDIAVGSESTDSTEVNYAIWLLQGDNDKLVLIDAGFTDTIQHPQKTFSRPDLVLEKLNISPKQITDIIITHPHWDHIGGIDLFPNAMLWMQEDDYNYFTGAAWQQNAINRGLDKNDVPGLLQKNLDGKLTLVKGDDREIIPGIKVFIGSKHTFESQYVLVNGSAGKTILASDNIWFYHNLHQLLPIPLTFDPEAYVREMQRMKTLVLNEQLIIPGHDPKVFTLFPKITEGVVKIELKN